MLALRGRGLKMATILILVRAAKPTADPVPVGSPRLFVPDNAAVEVRQSETSLALRPKPKDEAQSSHAPTLERADSAPFGAPRPKLKIFAALRSDAALEEPIEVCSDSPADPIEDF